MTFLILRPDIALSFRSVPFVTTGKYERLVDPVRLTAHQRAAVWAGIKKQAPALAELLKNDVDFAALKLAFDGSVRFSASDVSHYLIEDK